MRDRDTVDGGNIPSSYVPEDSAAKNAPAPVAAPVANTQFTTPMTISGQTDSVAPITYKSPVEAALGKDIGSSVDYKGSIQAANDAAAAARGAADPLQDIKNRPQAPASDDAYIYYYSWIGGATSGNWELYRAPNNDENEAKYGSRRFGGPTQATGRSAVGAGALIDQPQPILNAYGVLTGWATGDGKVLDGSGKPMLDADGKPVTVEGAKTLTQGISGSGSSSSGGGFGSSGGGFGSGSSASKEISDTTRDAFAALTDLFRSYGLDSLAGEISGYMKSGLTSAEALIKLKTNPSGAYAERFAGNFARQKAGLNVMSESAYIELENSYANTLKAYGLGNMLSTDSKQNWKQFSTWIANDINAPEFRDRIATVEDRVINADSTIKATFQKFFPTLTDQDLISYFLNPEQTLPKLKEKVTAAEIGSAFLGQGLLTDVSSATELAKYGVDRAGALQGAADIKSVLPTSEKLSSIYGEAGIKYTQKSGEEEFLKSNQDAAEQRKRLKSMERAQFQGDSGVSQQFSSVGKSIQGAY